MSTATIETHQQQATDLVVQAKELRITNAQDYETAVGIGRQLRDIKNAIIEYWDGTDESPGPIKRAYAAWKSLTVKRAEMVDPIEKAIQSVSGSIGTYDREQERKRQEAQRLLEEQARQEREAQIKAELEAAKAAGASAAERKEMKKAAESVPVVAPTVSAPEKPKGVSVPKTWKARLIRHNPQAHFDLIEHVGKLLSSKNATERSQGKMLAGMIPFSEPAATAISKPWKGTVSVPGVEFYEDSSVRFGR